MIYAGYNPRFSSDEQYTPAYAVAPIIKYIPRIKPYGVRLIRKTANLYLL